MSEKQKRRIASLKGEVAELQRFLDRWQALSTRARDAQQKIMKIHLPYVDINTSLSDGLTEGALVLRCTVCRTSEHHTYGPLNDVIWPCPTVQALLDPTVYQIKGTVADP